MAEAFRTFANHTSEASEYRELKSDTSAREGGHKSINKLAFESAVLASTSSGKWQPFCSYGKHKVSSFIKLVFFIHIFRLIFHTCSPFVPSLWGREGGEGEVCESGLSHLPQDFSSRLLLFNYLCYFYCFQYDMGGDDVSS